MESRGSDFYNANQLENDQAKRRVIPNLPPRPQATFTHQIANQTNPANALDTSFQRRAYYGHWRVNLRHSWHSQFLADRQSIDGSSAFAGAVAGQSLLSHGVPSAGSSGQLRSSAPWPPVPHRL